MDREATKLKFVPGSRRFLVSPTCPCGKSNRDGKFSPFLGFSYKGYCHGCGKTFYPNLKEESLSDSSWHYSISKRTLISQVPTSTEKSVIPNQYFEETINPPDIKTIRANSSLFKGLINNKQANIPEEVIIEAFNRFAIGYSDFHFHFHTVDPSYWSQGGSNIFWLIDEHGDIRGGQVVLYNSDSLTVSTLKTPDRHTRPVYLVIEQNLKAQGQKYPEWLTSYRTSTGNKIPCPFGLPQLKNEPITKPIALCEGYKTALVGHIYIPHFIWLAIGSRGLLSSQRLKAIGGRTVHLFPDLSSDGSTYKLWQEQATNLQKHLNGNWYISRILEDAPGIQEEEKKAGVDLADYLLTRCNWPEFQKRIAIQT